MLNIIQPVNELRFTSKSDFTTPCSKLLLTYSEDRKKKKNAGCENNPESL